MDQLAERRELYNGFGNALALGIEFALGPVIFGGLGWLLDGWLGLFPVLTVVLSIIGVVASFLRTWYRYDAEMREKEAQAVWQKHGRTVMTSRTGS